MEHQRQGHHARALPVRKRRSGQQLLYGLGVLLLLGTVVLTKSRGALVATMLVPGVYILRRFGIKAVIPAAVLAAPAKETE